MRRFAKEEKSLRQLQEWQKKHLRMHSKVNYNYALTADAAINGNRNDEYRRTLVVKEFYYVSDTSRRFPLGKYGAVVEGWVLRSNHLIDVFRERHALRMKLRRELRDDLMFDQIEQTFYGIMVQLLHAYSFFQYDRIENDAYRNAGDAQITQLLDRCEQLLEHYGSYLSMQGAEIFAAPYDDVSSIQIAIETMEDALQEPDAQKDHSRQTEI